MNRGWSPPAPRELLQELTVDLDGRERLANLSQGTPEWLRSRHGRLTASNFGAAVGHQGKAKMKELLKHMVWPETAGLTGFVRRLAQYGTDHEDIARNIYVADRNSGANPLYADTKFRIFERGLLVSVTHGWLGASPDFVVEESANARTPQISAPANVHHLHDPYVIEHSEGYFYYLQSRPAVAVPPDAGSAIVQGCGEIKCPAAKVKVFYSEKAEHATYGFPVYYYDQIQGAMAINSWPWCDVVIFTPERTQVTRFSRNEPYWSRVLFPKLHAFYFQMFLPALGHRVAGRLAYGDVDLTALEPALPPLASVWVSPHPEIYDPLPWFTKRLLSCTFVVIAC
jgi:hypothetical protein